MHAARFSLNDYAALRTIIRNDCDGRLVDILDVEV
jgi:hypothetical protein